MDEVPSFDPSSDPVCVDIESRCLSVAAEPTMVPMLFQFGRKNYDLMGCNCNC